ncbi:hypothetical protein F2Q70_00001436 [Brassica cretica]|uniref:Uncharacterized protein n=1 Tax=Brassica cretica TaxID=69181 RepID=A0A8S9IU65_BRACR|nr:hypothetical protein F2Q70_00001436 [Brassica cretica]
MSFRATSCSLPTDINEMQEKNEVESLLPNETAETVSKPIKLSFHRLSSDKAGKSPEFAGDIVLTKFWELTHFSFVGTAAAYGLFSRRSVESSVNSRMSCVDESSLSYVCSSVFDEDSCNFRSDESHLIQVNARASVYL